MATLRLEALNAPGVLTNSELELEKPYRRYVTIVDLTLAVIFTALLQPPKVLLRLKHFVEFAIDDYLTGGPGIGSAAKNSI